MRRRRGTTRAATRAGRNGGGKAVAGTKHDAAKARLAVAPRHHAFGRRDAAVAPRSAGAVRPPGGRIGANAVPPTRPRRAQRVEAKGGARTGFGDDEGRATICASRAILGCHRGDIHRRRQRGRVFPARRPRTRPHRREGKPRTSPAKHQVRARQDAGSNLDEPQIRLGTRPMWLPMPSSTRAKSSPRITASRAPPVGRPRWLASAASRSPRLSSPAGRVERLRAHGAAKWRAATTKRTRGPSGRRRTTSSASVVGRWRVARPSFARSPRRRAARMVRDLARSRSPDWPPRSSTIAAGCAELLDRRDQNALLRPRGARRRLAEVGGPARRARLGTLPGSPPTPVRAPRRARPRARGLSRDSSSSSDDDEGDDAAGREGDRRRCSAGSRAALSRQLERRQRDADRPSRRADARARRRPPPEPPWRRRRPPGRGRPASRRGATTATAIKDAAPGATSLPEEEDAARAARRRSASARTRQRHVRSPSIVHVESSWNACATGARWSRRRSQELTESVR